MLLLNKIRVETVGLSGSIWATEKLARVNMIQAQAPLRKALGVVVDI